MRGPAAARDDKPGSGRGAALQAAGIMTLALLARLPWLERLGLHGDEDISTLAARGIVEGGLPNLPSGNLYLRAPIYHYLIAPLAATGIDWLPRLVSVVASAVTAVLLVRLGRRFVGERAALLGGLLFCVSLFEIHFARVIRSYATYEMLALLAVTALYLLWEERRARYGWLAVASIALGFGLHAMAATLALLFLVAALRADRPGLRWGSVAAATVIGLLSLVQQRLILSDKK